MIKKLMSVMLVLTLVFGMFLPTMPKVQAQGNDDVEKQLDVDPYLKYRNDNPEMRAEMDARIKELASEVDFSEVAAEATVADNEENFTFNGGTKLFLGYDNVDGDYFKEYTLRSIGEHVEVWVANEISFEDDRPDHVVTQEQVDSLRDEFDNNIYEKDTTFFGMPDSHDGTEGDLEAWGYVPEDYYAPEDGVERVIMLVDNCRDEAYYDPSYPFYVAGFYSGTFEDYFDRNIINIDTNRWDVRIPSNDIYGTVAHEFQHLIHDDNDAEEESWVNEGMSDFAEYLCGYGHPQGHVNFFLEHPENSLVEWDEHYTATTGPETLADYGQAYLFTLYLNEKYGSEFVRALAKNETEGISGVNEILNQFNIGVDFTELFRRFSLAVAIDDTSWQGGIYGYDTIDLDINYESALAFDKDGVPAWGADYKVLDFNDKIDNIKIDGIEYLPLPWEVVSDPLGSSESVLWGNKGHLRDNQIILEADLTNVDAATLNFDNYIDIEEDWDAGAVQVSVDNGETWVSLANENTVSQDNFTPNDQAMYIYNNLPGFTGYYDEWVKETFDLSTYAGQKILINFRYMTDAAYNDSGWFIDNIEIPEIGYMNDCSSLEGFKTIDEIRNIKVEYAISFINEKEVGKGKSKYKLINIDPTTFTEDDAVQLRQLFKDGTNSMVTWYAAPEGKKGTVDFSYEIIAKSKNMKNKQ
ncbi:immune inhibitor A [Clostridium sp. D2Q-11]|uniref:Immune inhibitor A n=1 Tax=Anaeromonas frigoriresistens TaxID=2683708 RepID=A0A942V0Q6_9FIRM|nr:immune inhibitor A domain-containing protein [Anaeromonas frigoriresistens]MBS4537917.1 immune inhibitor A [Anaeromonas frigoriresistens]